MIREIDGGSSHESQNSSIAHFGLNDINLIDSIIVKWPGGNVQHQINVSSNQMIEIEEIKDFQINDPIYKAGVWDEITISPFNKRVDNLSNSLN